MSDVNTGWPTEMPVLGTGFYWNDVTIGQHFKTMGRTLTESDMNRFITAAGMLEEMFTNVEFIKEESLMGARPCPGSMVFCFAEGLLMMSTMQRTGLAFLECDIRILRPTNVGDTIHVESRVVEARATSNPKKGLLRTFSRVVNQRGEIVATYNPLRLVKTRPE